MCGAVIGDCRGKRKIGFSGQNGDKSDDAEDSTFHHGRELHFAAGPHAFETGPGIESSESCDESAHTEEVEEQNRITGKCHGRKGIAVGEEECGNENCCESQAGCESEHTAGGMGNDGFFANQLDQVLIKLEDGGTFASGKECFDFVDDAGQKRSSNQHKYKLNKPVCH